jgi:hypothetical protein
MRQATVWAVIVLKQFKHRCNSTEDVSWIQLSSMYHLECENLWQESIEWIVNLCFMHNIQYHFTHLN